MGGMASFVPVTLVLVALLGVAVWLRRRVDGQGWGPGTRVRLTPEHAVHVVTVEGRRWMIGTGPGGAPALLAELPPAEPQGG
ncbi:MAG: hypothetical protein AAGA54_27095 [Myxococcota bacterium]